MRWWWADHSELGERRPKVIIPKWSEPASRCDADVVRAHASKRDSDREVAPNLGTFKAVLKHLRIHRELRTCACESTRRGR